MKSISLKLQEQILSETDSILESLETSRNRYINDAVAYYNKVQKQKLLAEQLAKESNLVKEDSMRILQEFEQLEDES